MEVILLCVVAFLGYTFVKTRGFFSHTQSIVATITEVKQVGSYKFPDYVIITDKGAFQVFTGGEFAYLEGLKGECLRIEYKEGYKLSAPGAGTSPP